jgi:tRNA-Thr(GGU) m(6)t(6)A37 methyltransferase TsaA
MRWDETRPGEQEVPLPARTDASLVFIGRIETPYATRDECPRQGDPEGPLCRIIVAEPWRAALNGLERYARIEVLYWMHQARRDLVTQSPRGSGTPIGTFALRSPVRPNPVATALCPLIGIDGPVLTVRGLDCVNGTPLIDLKPDRSLWTPPQRSDDPPHPEVRS